MTLSSVITTGGGGTRMAAPIPKQYLDLAGLPVLTRTLMAFIAHPLVVIVSCLQFRRGGRTIAANG